MDQSEMETLLRLATKYIWWKAPQDALHHPQQVIAQVMNIGDYDDVQSLTKELGEEYLISVLQQAEAGQFNARSWTFWHYRLRLCEPGQVPALPRRRIA
jgi:hypothetical protein